ncbi:MAG: DNA-directed RNA polymerase subunit alpha [Clostridiales bacterium]|nr:DNA-directed RNA polymerase subunit alpha [Clostridiales bacterium]HAW15216.1 DNA-directed RNA polymerase subunit alpha [Clostridiales bacterium]
MNDILEPTIECKELSDNGSYGKYVISPLERGYGTTLGNSLRRVLLSSLTGAAVTAIKIDDTYHEFSIVPGIIEDMTEIILNIKGIRAKLHTESPKTVCISVTEGKVGELTAGDIVHDDEVEIMNPDHVIAHLNGESKVFMELTISCGRGYNTAEQNKIDGQAIGIIAIDSIFTPIKRANYVVENTRVGERTDYDSLTLEVWTDGTIKVDEALASAADILIQHLNLFTTLTATDSSMSFKSIETKSEKNSELGKLIEDLDFSVRTYNCLKRAAINTVGDLISRSEDDMIKVRNLGKKSLDEVIAKLGEMGLHLANNEE